MFKSSVFIIVCELSIGKRQNLHHTIVSRYTVQSDYQAHLAIKHMHIRFQVHAVFLPKSVQTITNKRSVVGGTKVERAQV